METDEEKCDAHIPGSHRSCSGLLCSRSWHSARTTKKGVGLQPLGHAKFPRGWVPAESPCLVKDKSKSGAN
ncbi:hypothetical protein SLA2020_140170 [Shorea laevis]